MHALVYTSVPSGVCMATRAGQHDCYHASSNVFCTNVGHALALDCKSGHAFHNVMYMVPFNPSVSSCSIVVHCP